MEVCECPAPENIHNNVCGGCLMPIVDPDNLITGFGGMPILTMQQSAKLLEEAESLLTRAHQIVDWSGRPSNDWHEMRRRWNDDVTKWAQEKNRTPI